MAGSAASAGDGWISCDYSSSGIILAANTNYKASVYSAGGSQWRTSTQYFWGDDTAGHPAYHVLGDNGFTNGVLSAPSSSGATAATNYNQNGSTYGPGGQQTWSGPGVWAYPDSFSWPENDWVDIEVGPPILGRPVAAGAIPQPVPPATVGWSPRAGTAPYWWPITVASAGLAQPSPPAQVFVALQPGAAAPTVILGWPVQSLLNIPQPPPSARIGWSPPPGVSPYWWPIQIASAGLAQPPPAARVGWSPPPGISPYWWPITVQSSGLAQPLPTSAQTFVGLTPGQAAAAAILGWPVQSSAFPQPPPLAQVLWSPRPSTSPYWWPLYIQSAGIPQPALNPPGVVVVGLTPGIPPGAIFLGWPVAATAIPQPPTTSRVLWSPRPGTAPYWWPILVRSAAPGQDRGSAQIFVFAIIPPPPPPFTVGQVGGQTVNLAGLTGRPAGRSQLAGSDELRAVLEALTEYLGRVTGYDEET